MMKRLLIVAITIATGFGSALAQEAETPNTLVWCGLDYSRVKMIGTQDFREPDNIFPHMLESWNALFMKEMLPKLERMAPGLQTSTKTVQRGNAKLNAGCIVRQDGTEADNVKVSHITERDIAASVKAYDIKLKQGLGLVFIMDRLVKAQQTACLYVVFFDIASRKVVYSERRCEKARGAGFRNYWFGPVKRVVNDLPGLYQKAKADK